MPNEATASGSECVWFFVPLQEPIGLPHGWICRGQIEPSPQEVMREGATAPTLSHSLFVHQLTLSPQAAFPTTDALFDLAVRATEPAGAESSFVGTRFAAVRRGAKSAVRRARSLVETLKNRGRSPYRFTVIEVALPVPKGASDETISNLFDEGLGAIRHLQRCHAVVQQNPVRLVSRQQLPPVIPMVRGRLRPGAPAPSFEGLSGFITGYETMATVLAPEDLNSEEQDRLTTALETLGPDGEVFSTYADLRNEAWCQWHREGNLRLGGLITGVSGEVLLDALLLHLMWEEGSSPDVAANLFETKRDHKARVMSEYHSRIGGVWAENRECHAATYLKSVVYLRNRIAHGGYEPTAEEVKLAQATLAELEGFIGDRLTAPEMLNRWPRTAVKWMGVDGLKRRGRWTKAMDQLINDPDEPVWMHTFRSWRGHFQRLRGYGIPEPGTTLGEVELYVELQPDGTERWLLHDAAALMGALVDGSKLASPEQLSAVEALHATTKKAGVQHAIRSLISVDFDAVPLPQPVQWQPDYELFPEAAIHLPQNGGRAKPP